MEISLAILFFLCLALVGTAYLRGGPNLALQGLHSGAQLLIGVAPQLLLGFALAGLITVLLPGELVASLVGAESGFRGVLIATLAGIATPGGPFLQFPLVAALSSSGAGMGPVAAYITAWSLISMNRALVWELPILGLHFTAVRWALSLALPLIIGLVLPSIHRATTR